MKIKLDENLGARGAQVLGDGGCDVATVVAEGLCSSSDETLIEGLPRGRAHARLPRRPELYVKAKREPGAGRRPRRRPSLFTRHVRHCAERIAEGHRASDEVPVRSGEREAWSAAWGRQAESRRDSLPTRRARVTCRRIQSLDPK